MVVGKKYAELEGKVATAASVTQEHGKNQAALKAQLATQVSTDFSLPFPSLPFPSFLFVLFSFSCLLPGFASVPAGSPMKEWH